MDNPIPTDFLILHQTYPFDTIEALAEQHGLCEKTPDGLTPFADDFLDGEIGEVVLPLYFDDESLAANFVLSRYAETSFWRCIYVCAALSHDGVAHV